MVEWGLAGDPTDPNDTGKKPKAAGVDATGTNFVYVYPRLTAAARPIYTVVEKRNLQYSPTWDPADATEVGAGAAGYGAGVQGVTNLVPIDADVKFFNVDIQEP